MTARASLRLGRRHRIAVDAALATILVTGVLWLALDPGDSAEAISAGARRVLKTDAALHALAGLLSMVALGTLWSVHIRRAWRSGRNRVGGSATFAAFVAMAATGWALGYAGGAVPHDTIAHIHWIGGLVGTAVYLAHRLRGAGTRPRSV